MQRRLTASGLAGAKARVQGDDVLLSFPDGPAAKQLALSVTAPAQLLFRPVICTIPAYVPTPGSSATPGPVGGVGSSQLAQSVCAPGPAAGTGVDPNISSKAGFASTAPGDDVGADFVILPPDPKAISSRDRYVLGPADVTGADVADATAVVSGATGQYAVGLTLTSSGAAKFDQIAAMRYACYQADPANPEFCSMEAFELDGLVEAAPVFQASSFAGAIQITGDFTKAQATALADELKYGSLPVRFTVGP